MFEKITPEAAGFSSERVKEYIEIMNRRGARFHSVIMMRGDKIFYESYWAPFDENFCHRLYSQTKSYVAVAIGLLQEEGKLNINDKIADYFPEKIKSPLKGPIKDQTIKEMLTMSTVGQNAFWFDTDFADRTEMYFNYKRSEGDRPAGTIWEYDSAGSQVLSSLVEKLSGMPIFDYLGEKIFKHLGTFKTAEMLKTRNGDTWGDSAMVCTARDMLSFARFVLNFGTWDGKRLMNEEYLREATSPVVSNKENSHYQIFYNGYGYQFWSIENGGFMFNGMGNQYTMCFPDEDVIFLCMSDAQGNQASHEYVLTYFVDMLLNHMSKEPLPENPEAYSALINATASLKLFAVSGMEDSPFRREISGKRFICRENPMGITEFTFDFDEDGKGGRLLYKNEQGDKVLPFGVNRNEFGRFPEFGYSDGVGGARTTNGFTYKDAVSLAWLEDKKLMICVQIIDRYFGNCSMIFAFKGNICVARMTKTAEDFLGKYEGDLIADME